MFLFRTRRVFVLMALMLCTLLPVTSGLAQKETEKARPPQNLDLQALGLMDQMTAAYKVMNSFSITISTEIIAAAPVSKSSLTLSFKKPNLVSAVIKNGEHETQAIADGKNIFATSSKDKTQYTKSPVKEGEGMVAQTVLGSAQGAMTLGLAFIAGLDPFKNLSKNMTSLSVAEPAVINGVPVSVVVAEMTSPPGKITFSMGKEDHLLRQIVFNINRNNHPVTITETHTDLKINPKFEDGVFAFNPPPGAKEVGPPEPPKYYDENLKPGLEVKLVKATDLAGKTVSLDQYKGKVVLLDFWATWCGPCREEVPNVVAAYHKFKAKGFEVVSISLDESEDRAKLLEYTRKNNMNWRHVFDGKAWKGDLPEQFKVKAIPFAMLIGRDGKIAAVNVRGEELEPAVIKALEQK